MYAIYRVIYIGMARGSSILCRVPAEGWEGGGVKLWGALSLTYYIYRYGARR